MCISEVSKAIIAMPKNGGWDRIGLFDVGELAARLTDIDIHAVLSVTDAQNKLKSLWCYGDKCHEAVCPVCIIKSNERSKQDNTRECPGCLNHPNDFSLAKNRKQKEVEDELTQKNNLLTGENKQLRKEIEGLRKKMSSGLGILG